jgi:hypothetical protein
VKVMEMGMRVLGKEHPHTLNSMACLVLTYQAQGRCKEAEDQVVEKTSLERDTTASPPQPSSHHNDSNPS